MKYKTMSHFILIEQELLHSIDVEIDDEVKVTLEKLPGKEKILDKHLRELAAEKGFSKMRILAEKNNIPQKVDNKKSSHKTKAGGVMINDSSQSESKNGNSKRDNNDSSLAV